MRSPTISRAVAVRLILEDHRLLLDRIEDMPEKRLYESVRIAEGSFGHFCESLHDLMSHILMWDEITLAVLTEAAHGRNHWSLDPRWETPSAGRALNLGGVHAGREVAAGLLKHRLHSVSAALVAELERYDEAAWTDPGTGGDFDGSIGALAEYVATPPDGAPYGHVARHLVGETGLGLSPDP